MVATPNWVGSAMPLKSLGGWLGHCDGRWLCRHDDENSCWERVELTDYVRLKLVIVF